MLRSAFRKKRENNYLLLIILLSILIVSQLVRLGVPSVTNDSSVFYK